jgi:hypothetical protein
LKWGYICLISWKYGWGCYNEEEHQCGKEQIVIIALV